MSSTTLLAGLLFVSTIYIAVILPVVHSSEDKAMLHCMGDQMVIGSNLMDANEKCANSTCMFLCFLKELEGLDADGLPTKELILKLCDEYVAPSIRDEVKKMTCFDEHASKIAKNEDVSGTCATAKDLETCFETNMKEICKKKAAARR